MSVVKLFGLVVDIYRIEIKVDSKVFGAREEDETVPKEIKKALGLCIRIKHFTLDADPDKGPQISLATTKE